MLVLPTGRERARCIRPVDFCRLAILEQRFQLLPFPAGLPNQDFHQEIGIDSLGANLIPSRSDFRCHR